MTNNNIFFTFSFLCVLFCVHPGKIVAIYSALPISTYLLEVASFFKMERPLERKLSPSSSSPASDCCMRRKERKTERKNERKKQSVNLPAANQVLPPTNSTDIPVAFLVSPLFFNSTFSRYGSGLQGLRSYFSNTRLRGRVVFSRQGFVFVLILCHHYITFVLFSAKCPLGYR